MPERKARLVVADADAMIRRLLVNHGERNGFEVLLARDGEEAVELVDEQTKALIVDLEMPGIDGFGCLARMTKEKPSVPVIILSDADETVDAVRAIKMGATDFFSKPFEPAKLMEVISKTESGPNCHLSGRAAFEESHQQIATEPESAVMQEIYHQVSRVARLDSTVLLTGESGVGKGVMARRIHEQSQRKDMPFVTVSCPAMPRQLLESELFGHEKGAFTGALKKRMGKMELAKGGTIFLDEIGELPADLQPKLLNVLQDRVFHRVGGEELLQADVRIVAATNINFEQKIAAGEFREDLYYRLSVIPIEIPPLRERLDGLEHLANSLLKKISHRIGLTDLKITPDAIQLMKTFPWPGNVRELENVLERSAAFSEQGVIGPDDLPNEIAKRTPGSKPEEPLQESSGSTLSGIGGLSLSELEREAIMQTLNLCGGNKAEAARRLGVTEKTVYNKMKRHGLSTDKSAQKGNIYGFPSGGNLAVGY